MSRKTFLRILALVIIAGLAGLYFALGLQRYFSFEHLRKTQEAASAYYSSHRVLVIAIYMAGYIVMAGLSLPGAAGATLVGGAVFGLWAGTVIVSFASSIGALAACVVARHILGSPVRERLRGRFGGKLDAIDRGVQREGAFYLFTLRLVPVFPFFIINIAAGLTGMRLWTFYWVSQLGMLPATFVYVNAGQELGRLRSASGILSPRMIAAFALLGIMPLAARKALELYRGRMRRASGEDTNAEI